MKSEFPGWYPKSAEELARLWDSAIFVPDTNILLHCLRHEAQVREDLLRILEVLKDSLWIPYQVGLEFHRNRLAVEGAALDAYDFLTKEYEAAANQIQTRLRQVRAHPNISVERESSAVSMFLADFKSRIAKAKAEHPEQAIAAAVNRLTALFAGRIGEPWPEQRLAALRKEGEERYAKRIPPGYKDKAKEATDHDRFGDLIIWKDMIERAKSQSRPVILVTDDVKEDWWWEHRGRKLGARPELVEEFQRESGQAFHIYQLPQFLHIAADRNSAIASATVVRIEKSLEEDEHARRAELQNARGLKERIAFLETEREQILARLAGIPDPNEKAPNREERDRLRSRLATIDQDLEALQPVPSVFTPSGA